MDRSRLTGRGDKEYSVVRPYKDLPNAQRLVELTDRYHVACISAHSPFAAGTWFRAQVNVGQRRLLVGACRGPEGAWLGWAAMG